MVAYTFDPSVGADSKPIGVYCLVLVSEEG